MKLKSVGLILASMALLCSCEKEDVTCGGTVTFRITNKTPEILEIKIQGSIPSGCGSVGPGSSCATSVPTGVSIPYSARGNNSKNVWDGQEAMANCQNVNISLTY